MKPVVVIQNESDCPAAYLGDALDRRRVEWKVVLLYEGQPLPAVRDVAGVAALGGASKRIGDRWIVKLLEARRILAASDTDPAGEEGAARLLLQSERIRRVHPLRGRDLTDFYQAGGNLRAWVVYHLERMSHDTSESAESEVGAILGQDPASVG